MKDSKAGSVCVLAELLGNCCSFRDIAYQPVSNDKSMLTISPSVCRVYYNLMDAAGL